MTAVLGSREFPFTADHFRQISERYLTEWGARHEMFEKFNGTPLYLINLLTMQRTEYQVEVEVTCPAGGEATLSLAYTVGGAAWTPSYEARLDEARASLDLATFATVHQATGEDYVPLEQALDLDELALK